MSEPCPECGKDHVPNATTRKAMAEAESIASTIADTRQAVDAARHELATMIRGFCLAFARERGVYVTSVAKLEAFEAAVEAWARADERARRNAEIGAASQDETENRP